jgi:hypothetical protein
MDLWCTIPVINFSTPQVNLYLAYVIRVNQYCTEIVISNIDSSNLWLGVLAMKLFILHPILTTSWHELNPVEPMQENISKHHGFHRTSLKGRWKPMIG